MSCRARGVFHVTVPAPPHVSIFKNSAESLPQVSINEDVTQFQSFTVLLPPEAFQQGSSQGGSQGGLQKTCREILSVISSNETLVLSSSITVSEAAGGCQISFIPNPNASGDLQFIVISTSYPTDQLSIPITIIPNNDPPIVPDIATVSAVEGATTVISIPLMDDTLGLTCLTAVTASSSSQVLIPDSSIVVSGIFPDCQLSYTPIPNQSGSADITILVSDGSVVTSKTITVAITAVNDPPVISDVAGQLTNEDTVLGGVSFSISDPDSTLSCSSPTVTASSSNQTLISSSNITISEDSPNNCLVSLSPSLNQTGNSTITLTVTDGSLSARDTFVLTVNPINDTPTDISLTSLSLAENAGANAVVGSLSATDPDLGDTFTYSLVAGAGSTDNASFNIATNQLPNQLQMISSADFETKSSYSVRLRATDLGGLFFEKQFTITITNINEAPSVLSVAYQTTNQDTPTTPIAITISDVDGPIGDCNSTYLSYTSQNISVVAATGAVSWSGTWPNCTAAITPVTGATGSSLISISASDGTLTGQSQSFTLQVGSVPVGWYQEAYLKASNADANDLFGTSVSISGDTAIVGALGEASNQTTIINGATSSADNTARYAGASYIFKRTGSLSTGYTWVQEAYLKASNANALDFFGNSVSISGDTAIVGAKEEDSNQTMITNGTTPSADNSASLSGASYIYKRTGSLATGYTWVQEAYLKASNAEAYDVFGTSVSISGDTAVVGAKWEASAQNFITNGTTSSADNSATQAGASYIYKRTGSLASGYTWAQEAYLKASNPNAYDGFGISVSLSGDTAIVGASTEDSNQTVITNGTSSSSDNGAKEAGASYIYKRTGSMWTQEAYLKASNADTYDYFGRSVSMSGDTAIVGTSSEASSQTTITNGTTASPDNTAGGAGASYIYKRTGSLWAQEAYLKASNADAFDYFGTSVSLSGDTAIVGAEREASNQTTITNGATSSADNTATYAGASYIYKRTGSLVTGYTWAQEAYLKASNTTTIQTDWFGASVSISGDTAIVGAKEEDSNQTTITNGMSSSADNSATSAGAVYVYRNLSRMFEAYEISSIVTSSSFTVSWNGTNLGSANGTFKMVYDTTTPSLNCSSGTVAYTGTATSVAVTSGLTPGQSYIVRICAFDGVNYSEGVTTAVTVKGDDIGPKVLSINRGSTPNPVTFEDSQIDYIVTFDEPVIGLNPDNFSLSEVTTTKGATGQISSISCSGAVCTVWVQHGNSGQLRLDLSSTVGVGDIWGNPLTATKIGDETFTLSPAWYQEAYIKASNSYSGDLFGSAVSISESTVIVGAEKEDSNQTTITNGTTSSIDNTFVDAGASYIYKRTGSLWAQEAFIKASNAGSIARFGSSVAISGDTAIVGALDEGSGQTTITNGTTSSLDTTFINGHAGASYIYKRTGSTWAQEAYLKASNANTLAYYGQAVALSGDTAVVGAYGEASSQTTITNGTASSPDNTAGGAGASYIYKRTGSTWAQEAYFKASNANASDFFGASVSISGDTVIVGAYGEASIQATITNGINSSPNNIAASAGASYIYKRIGSLWAQEAYIKASNANGYDYFGCAVSLSGDTAIVGARGESSAQTTITNGTSSSLDMTATNAGASYIYRRSGSSWAQEAYIKSSNADASDDFGRAVSISGDSAIVGAPSEDSNQTFITNGKVAIINNYSLGAGASYIFTRSGTSWYQEGYLKASNSNTGNAFGFSVSLSGDTALVGSRGETSSQTTITNGTTSGLVSGFTDSGAVYVYRNLSRVFEVYEIASAVSSTSFTINWKGSNLGSGNGNFKVVYSTVEPLPTCSNGNIAYIGSATSVSVSSGLTSGQSYIVRICAFDGTNYSEGITTQITVKGDDVGPSVLSITRGSTPNPVFGANLIDYIVTFDEPVINLNSSNFSLTEVVTTKGATGDISSISCTGSVCTVWVKPGNTGQLRLDLSTSAGVADVWGNPLLAGRTGDQTFTLGGWAQEAYIKASNANAYDYFGASVSISGDTAIVGAYGEASSQVTITNGTGSSLDNAATIAGASYIYKRTGSTWAQEAYIKASNANASDLFGTSVSISGDTAIVGAYGEASSQTTITNGINSSAVNTVLEAGSSYIYKRTGSTWAQEAYIKASNADASDRFGASVSISGDTAIVGAYLEGSSQTTITNGTTSSPDKSAANAGSSYIYKRTGSLPSGYTWVQEAYLKASNANASDLFGASVSVSGDTAIVGAYGEASSETTITNGTTSSPINIAAAAGASYIYRRTGTSWDQEAYIKTSNASAGDFFGINVSISGDSAIVGASSEDSNQSTITNGSISSSDNTFTDAGASYIYRRTGTIWDQEAYLKASNANVQDFFGTSVSISGNTVIVGAIYESSNQTTITNGPGSSLNNSLSIAGASYIFKKTTSSWNQEAYLKASNANTNNLFGTSVGLSGDTALVGSSGEASSQTTITNGPISSQDNSASSSGAVYAYRHSGRIFDPDLRVSAKTTTSITLSWGSNLGVTTRVKIAPAVSGTANPLPCTDASAIALAAGINTYTYTGLATGTKYGFRVCGFDGTNVSEGAIIRDNTN